MEPVSLAFVGFGAGILAVYYAIPREKQWLLLLAANFLFLGKAGMLPLLSAAISYWAGLRKDKQTLHLFLLTQFGLLLACKALLLGGWLDALPIGISFFSFQAAGYVMDVHRRKTQPEPNFFRLTLFLTFFPQLIQGPISRFDALSPQLHEGHAFSREDFLQGFQRTVWGYFKKLVIADRIAPAVAVLRTGDYGGLGTLLLSFFYCVRIYGDFTGGIDIVLGFSRMLGIRLPENFDNPFCARSIAEFWRRWHMSLGEWIRDYVFYPLSVCAPMRRFGRWSRKRLGSFGKRLSVYAASCGAWLVTGFWHGLSLNFPLWGLLNFGAITVSQELGLQKRLSPKAGMVLTFVTMNFIRICDLYPNPADYGTRLLWLLTRFLPNGSIPINGFLLPILSFGLALWAENRHALPPAWICIPATLIFGSYGVGYSASSFIYNGF